MSKVGPCYFDTSRIIACQRDTLNRSHRDTLFVLKDINTCVIVILVDRRDRFLSINMNITRTRTRKIYTGSFVIHISTL